MEDLISLNLSEVAPTGLVQSQIVLLVVGALYAFAGHRLLRLIIGLTGFLLAGAVAALLAAWLSQGNLWAMGGAGIFGGICGAMALFFLYRAGIFAIGGLGAAVALQSILGGRPEAWAPWVVFGGAIAGGLVAVLVERPVLVLATAAIGAWLMTYAGAFLLLGDAFREELAGDPRGLYVWGILGSWLLLTLMGVGVQHLTRKKAKRYKE